MICFPNGKINLGLRVLSKRKDGFHNIETILYPIPLSDALEFLPANSFQMKVSGFPLDGKTEDNIVFKAWELLHKKFKIPPLRIHLHKAIPTGSGLGGGSSDAAFFMQEVNKFFKLGIGQQELKKLLVQLGSDCPFFIDNKPSLASRRGEVLQPVKVSLTGKYLLVIKPKTSISTREAYHLVKPKKPKTNLSEIILEPIEQWKDLLKNDFEETLVETYPEILEIKNDLYQQGAVYASMSGSGSAVFGIFNNKPDLKNIHPKYYLWFGKF